MTHPSQDENYADGGYGHRLGFGKRPALLLIDFVLAYFQRDNPFFADVDEALASAIRITHAARHAGIPVVFTRVAYQAGGLDGGVFYRKIPALSAYLANSGLSGFLDELKPEQGDLIITKQYPSAFFGTSLATSLSSLGIDTVILAGLTTSGCVRASCVDAISHGFVPIIVREACGDRHPSPHEASLFDMNAKYGDVETEQAVVGHLKNIRRL
jgi:maleamate amidohydrolase